VIGRGPDGPDSGFGARGGMREAEAFARELVTLGVARDRIDLEAGVGAEPCPSGEARCPANRSRVNTSLATEAARRRRP